MTSATGPEANYSGEAGRKYALRFGNDPQGDILGRCFRDRFANWISSKDRVIEYGCGSGRNILALECAEKAGYDINEHSRATAAQAGLRVFNRTDDIPRGYWNTVVCNHVLEHVASPLQTLQLLKSLLVSDGKLVLTVPVQGHLLRLTPLDHEIDHHLYCWTPTTMRNLLLAAGFRPKEVVVRSAALEDRVEPLARVSWQLFKFGTWAAGVMLRRKEMNTLAEPLDRQ
jgi:SAM-dependent methyltransferase